MRERFSIGLGTTVDYYLSPAREHDTRHLTLDESWRGFGLIADLGYASCALLRDAERFGVKYVIRLKENWRPKVDAVRAGDVKKTFLPGADFDALLDDEVLALSGARKLRRAGSARSDVVGRTVACYSEAQKRAAGGRSEDGPTTACCARARNQGDVMSVDNRSPETTDAG